MKLTVISDRIISWTIVIGLGILPLFFLPMTQDFYTTQKWSLLTLSALIVLCAVGVRLIFTKTSVRPPPLEALAVFGPLTIAAAASLLFASSNRVEAAVNPFGVVTFGALTVLAVAGSSLSKQLKTMLMWVFYGAVTILSLIAVYQFFGMGRVMFPGVPYLTDSLWTPAGNTVTLLFVEAITISLMVPEILHLIQQSLYKNEFAFLILTGLTTAAGFIVTLVQFIPKIPSTMLPIGIGWEIAVKTIQTVRGALVGAGAENAVTAFTSGKPLSLMTSPLWNIRFAANSDFFLTIVTVFGLTGLVASVFLGKALLGKNDANLPARIIAIVGLLIFPPSITILSTIAILYVISVPSQSSIKTIKVLPLRFIGVISLVFAAACLYGWGRYYVGEVVYAQALAAAARNDGTNTYNLHIQALKTDPFISTYHITFSQTNLALANSIASSALSQSNGKTNQTIKESDRQLTGSLIQQAISEAKIAVTLDQNNIIAWENLGNVYQALMSVATGADSWADAAYTKALSLDPTNPILAVNLGGVLVHEKKYDEAITMFQRAVFIKSDYANAYYNLANAYKLKGDTSDAITTLTKTLSLVTPNSSDAYKVTTELDSLKNNPLQPVASPATGSSQLTLPQ